MLSSKQAWMAGVAVLPKFERLIFRIGLQQMLSSDAQELNMKEYSLLRSLKSLYSTVTVVLTSSVGKEDVEVGPVSGTGWVASFCELALRPCL